MANILGVVDENAETQEICTFAISMLYYKLAQKCFCAIVLY